MESASAEIASRATLASTLKVTARALEHSSLSLAAACVPLAVLAELA